MASSNFIASTGYSIILPTEIKFKFCIRFIKLLFAFLFKNIIFLLLFDKATCLSKNNFFFLSICLMGRASKNSLPIKITGPQFISSILLIHLAFLLLILTFWIFCFSTGYDPFHF